MGQSNDSSRTRNGVIGWCVAALLLAAFGCNYFYGKGKVDNPDDSINVSAKKIELPKGFDEIFKDFTGLLLVDKEGKVTAISTKGAPINLCGSPSKTECTLATTASALVYAASGALDIGTCVILGAPKSCHKDGPFINKWYWHRSPDTHTHFDCPDGCQ